MSETQPPLTASSTPPARLFAERFADFSKVLSIYPDANERVRRTLDEAMAALTTAREEATTLLGEGICLSFAKAEAIVGDARFAYKKGSNLAWLRERMDRCALAGVEFLHGIDPEIVIAFTRRLMANAVRREMDTPFEELWPEEYPGLRLIDRRFEGTFRTASTAAFREREREKKVVDTSDEQALAKILLADPEVVEILLDIQDSLNQQNQSAGESEKVKSMDLLGRIIKFMPAETLQEYDKVVELSRHVLEVLRDQIRDGDAEYQLSAVADSKTLRTMMFVVSRSLFGRQAPNAVELACKVEQGESTSAKAPDHRPRGHAGDDAIEDDVHRLLEEVDALSGPAEEAVELELRPEQLGVYLHYYVRLASPERRARLEPHIVSSLQGATDAELEVLRQYVEPLWEGAYGDAATAPYERVLDLLSVHGLTPLLRRCAALTLERARASFPRYFTTYLDTLDLSTKSDLDELAHLCLLLGPERIQSAAEVLAGRQGLHEAGRAQRLLAAPHPGLVPLVRLILTAGGARHRQDVAVYLRRVLPHDEHACFLRLPGGTDDAPLEYLQALMEPTRDRASEERMRPLLLRILSDYIRSRAGDHDELARAHAVRELVRFDRVYVETFLHQLATARKYLFWPREPRAVRAAAREGLARIRERARAGI